MNPLDILLILIFSYCTVLGFFRGFIREITAIAGTAGGFFCACLNYKRGAAFLSRWFSDPAYMNILSFFIIFFIVYTFAWLLGILIKKQNKSAFGKNFDRFSGVFAGALKSLLIASVLLIVLVAFLRTGSPVLKNSALRSHISLFSEKITGIIPGEMKKKYTEKAEFLQKNSKKTDGVSDS
ncbi:MAG: CvpA family protein [Desulfococcaceae bacterium]|jgi:membrane protein required for colicin V production|nr:CvpA family protein [Desulfococcaceae bacterium]